MSKPYAIALLGFTEMEWGTFESFFRLAARRVPGYELVESAEGAAMIVANADDPATMDVLLNKPPSVPVLLVGGDDGGTGWPIEPRPVKLMNVLTTVDQMVGYKVAAPVSSRRPSSGFDATRPFTGEELLQAGSAAGDAATGNAPAPADDGILVVDDSDTALHYMQNMLRRVGFTAELVRTAEEALERLKARPYRFVFLDVMLEGMDGYQACKLIKQRKYDDGKAPVVVMLTSKAGAIDKIKGSMAGCDAYLTKPADERLLLKLLAKYDDQLQRSFQATRLGGKP